TCGAGWCWATGGVWWPRARPWRSRARCSAATRSTPRRWRRSSSRSPAMVSHEAPGRGAPAALSPAHPPRLFARGRPRLLAAAGHRRVGPVHLLPLARADAGAERPGDAARGRDPVERLPARRTGRERLLPGRRLGTLRGDDLRLAAHVRRVRRGGDAGRAGEGRHRTRGDGARRLGAVRLPPDGPRLGAGALRRQPRALRLDPRTGGVRHHPALRRSLADPRLEPAVRGHAGVVRLLSARGAAACAPGRRPGNAGDARLRGHARGAARAAHGVGAAGRGLWAEPLLSRAGGGARGARAAHRAGARPAAEDTLKDPLKDPLSDQDATATAAGWRAFRTTSALIRMVTSDVPRMASYSGRVMSPLSRPTLPRM